MCDHFSSKLPTNNTLDSITPTISMSSSHISSIQKKFLPIATATKSETTATLQQSGGNGNSSSSSKFMSWMIPSKRTNDLNNDASSISSKKSSSSNHKDESLSNSKNIDIDVKRLYEFSTKDLHTFGYPPPVCVSPVDSINSANGNKSSGINSTASATNATSTSVTITNGAAGSATSTSVTPSSTIASLSSSLDGTSGSNQKLKVNEMFEKSGSITKIVEKDR